MTVTIPLWLLALAAAWLVVGGLNVALWRFIELRPGELGDHLGEVLLLGLLAWPVSLFTLAQVRLLRVREERYRQQRINEKIVAGEYSPEWATARLNWNPVWPTTWRGELREALKRRT